MLTDDSIMPWGKYKGEKMGNIPASYRNNVWVDFLTDKNKQYEF